MREQSLEPCWAREPNVSRARSSMRTVAGLGSALIAAHDEQAAIRLLVSGGGHYGTAVSEVDLPVREWEQSEGCSEEDQDPSGEGGDHPDD
jgi:hypothetical protein